MPPRAAPLPPAERRARILAAARPLLVAHGAALTTRQVATAAGIAEGTLFRVFPTKQHLLHALAEQALDPTEAVAALAALPPDQTLAERAVAIVSLLSTGITRVSEVFAALRAVHPGPPSHGAHRHPGPHLECGEALRSAIAAALAPYAAELTTSPEVAARLLHTVALTSAHPLLSRGGSLAPETLAHILLTGLAQEKSC